MIIDDKSFLLTGMVFPLKSKDKEQQSLEIRKNMYKLIGYWASLHFPTMEAARKNWRALKGAGGVKHHRH
jgi:hypothetical protein